MPLHIDLHVKLGSSRLGVDSFFLRKLARGATEGVAVIHDVQLKAPVAVDGEPSFALAALLQRDCFHGSRVSFILCEAAGVGTLAAALGCPIHTLPCSPLLRDLRLDLMPRGM